MKESSAPIGNLRDEYCRTLSKESLRKERSSERAIDEIELVLTLLGLNLGGSFVDLFPFVTPLVVAVLVVPDPTAFQLSLA